MGLKEIRWDDMDWNHLVLDRDQWRALVITVMNLRVTYNCRNSLTSWATVRFWWSLQRKKLRLESFGWLVHYVCATRRGCLVPVYTRKAMNGKGYGRTRPSCDICMSGCSPVPPKRFKPSNCLLSCPTSLQNDPAVAANKQQNWGDNLWRKTGY
jgi:hypothetical protein